MRDVEILLDDAEREYRRNAFRTYVLRSDIEIIKEKSPEFSHGANYWMWATDLKKTYVKISEPEKLRALFQGPVQTHWQADPEKLAIDVQQYLLWHESYHPKEAPFSDFKKNKENPDAPTSDRGLIRQAIWRGLKEANPSNCKGAMQISKVAVAENLVEDFILDNALYLDNLVEKYFRSDVIPVFDFMELVNEKKANTTQYTITRYLYGAMYGPASTHAFFESRMGLDGVAAAEEVMSALLKRKVTLPRADDNGQKHDLEKICKEVREIFRDTATRYEGITNMMKVLGRYQASNPRKGGLSNMSGNGVTGLAEDLMDGMTDEEKKEFLEQLADAKDNDAAANMLTGPSFGAGKDLPKQIQQINLYATHEQYKRRRPETVILGNGLEGVEQGKVVQQYFHPVRTEVMTQSQYMSGYNHQRMIAASIRTHKPWMIRLPSGLVRVIEY